MKHILLVIALLFALSGNAQNRYYVAATAVGAANGSTWADAFTDLQAALQLAQAGDTLWVAAGIYKPATTDRTISFVQPDGVRLFGGFAGTEISLDQRDWTTNLTILSGDIGVTGDSTDNSYNVLYMPYPDSTTVLDGFVLRDGLANYGGPTTSTDRRKCGAGLYVMAEDGDAYPLIRNCRFEHNTARLSGGGAMVNATGEGSAAPYFFNCVFVNNAAQNGGGLARLGASWIELPADLDSCVFEHNRATSRGGGFFYSDTERNDAPDIVRCWFENNTAAASGGGLFAFSGRADGCKFNLINSKFQENLSSHGAAVTLFTSGTGLTKSIVVRGCLFNKNYSMGPNGTGTSILEFNMIGTKDASVIINKSNFFKNASIAFIFGSSIDSAVIYASELIYAYNRPVLPSTSMIIFGAFGEGILIDKTTILNNTNVNYFFRTNDFFHASNCSIFNNVDSSSSSGAGYILLGTDPDSLVLINSTITNNSFQIANYIRPKQIIIKNCLLSGIPANNGPGENSFWESTVKTEVSYSHLGTLSCADLPSPVTCGPGILTGIDPQFVDPDSGDYRLQPCSPLVNAGNNAGLDTQMTDLSGQPRIQSDIVDIGAYETSPPQLAAPADLTPACPGGFSGAVAFQPEQGCPPYDYAWTSASGSGQGTGQLAPGSYVFTVTDTRGSYFTVAVTVPENDSTFELLAQPTPVACGDTLGGSAAVAAGGGLPPFAYHWGSGSADSLLSGLAAGAYPVTVTDAQGCSATGSVQVSLSGGLDIDVDVQEISCPGAADGSFAVQPANGQAPFVWQWAGGPSGPVYGPLGPGNYLGTLTDAFGCLISWVLPLNDPQPIAFDTVVVHATGPNTADGSASVDNLTGGQPPFGIVWSNGDMGFSADSLLPGLYTVTVTDDHNCTQTADITVSFVSGTKQPEPALSVTLRPNPAGHEAWLDCSLPVGGPVRLRVYDALGTPLLSREVDLPAGGNTLALPEIAAWPPGVYGYELRVGELRATGYLIHH